MRILADLHVHSDFSDGKMSIPQLVDFYGVRGFGCIAITDHVCETKTWLGRAARYLDYTLSEETFPIYLELLRAEAERAWSQYGMVVLPGIEISKNSWANQRSAHILGIGVTDFVSADLDVVEIARAIRAQGALAVAAHPVATRRFELQTLHLWSRRKELAAEFDAWEVASGPHFFEEVQWSGLPMIATSDLHHPQQINSWKTVLNCERKPHAIFAAIRRQELSFHFYRDPFSVRMGTDPHGAGDFADHGAGYAAGPLGWALTRSFGKSFGANYDADQEANQDPGQEPGQDLDIRDRPRLGPTQRDEDFSLAAANDASPLFPL